MAKDAARTIPFIAAFRGAALAGAVLTASAFMLPAAPAAAQEAVHAAPFDVETLAEGLKREYAVTVPAADLAAKMDEKLEAARADFTMKGFRKGKAPAALMKKMFGKNLLGEVLQESVDDAMRSHFEETGDMPSQQPDIQIKNEAFDEGQDLELELKYERLPDIPEANLAEIKVEKLVAEVTDGEVDEALGKLAENALRKMLISYVQGINKQFARTGPLFQGRFARKKSIRTNTLGGWCFTYTRTQWRPGW